MEFFGTVKAAQNNKQKKIENFKLELQAWQNVTRVYKRGGGDYASIQKNFENCRLYSVGGESFIIEVCFKDVRGIRNYVTRLMKGENGTLKADEVQALIDRQIKSLYKSIDDERRGIDLIEKQLDEIRPQLDLIVKAMDDAKKTGTDEELKGLIACYLSDYRKR